MIRCIILDFDDTLIFSGRGFIKTVGATASMLGLSTPADSEIMEYPGTWEDFIRKTWPCMNVDEFKSVYRKNAEEIMYEIIPGANECLEELAGMLHIYVVTNRQKEMLDFRIRQAGLRSDLIRRFFCYEDLKYRKPDPRAFDAVFDEVGSIVSRGETLSVGDRVRDMQASLGAGLRFAAVLTGYQPREEFLFHGMDERDILSSIALLPRYVQEIDAGTEKTRMA